MELTRAQKIDFVVAAQASSTSLLPTNVVGYRPDEHVGLSAKAWLETRTREELDELYEAELYLANCDSPQKRNAKKSLASILDSQRNERNRAYNHPSAKADFGYWRHIPAWRLDEFVALSLDRDPRAVSIRDVSPRKKYSLFAKRYVDRYGLAARAMVPLPGALNAVSQIEWIEFAEKVDIDLPPELIEGTEREVKDFKSLYHAAQEQLGQLEQSAQTITNLQQRIDELETELKRHPALDPEDARYAPELDVALKAYAALLVRDNLLKLTPRQWVRDWLGRKYPKMSDGAITRISIVVNYRNKTTF